MAAAGGTSPLAVLAGRFSDIDLDGTNFVAIGGLFGPQNPLRTLQECITILTTEYPKLLATIPDGPDKPPILGSLKPFTRAALVCISW